MQPIIFIPGIEATKLIDANTFEFDTVWNAFDTVGTALSSKITGPYIEEKLQLNPLFDESMSSIVSPNHIARLPYEKTILAIKSKINEGKSVQDPIFLFGYDWRLSNYENAKRLHVFISYLYQKLQPYKAQSFRFLTHSMGGLIFSCYLKLLNGNYGHIDKMILCAPPFKGSPYSIVHMIKGDGGFKSLLNRVLGRNDDIRKVVRTYPSLFELLPDYPNFLSLTETNENLSLSGTEGWQSNVYDDNIELFTSRLKQWVRYKEERLMDLSLLPQEMRDRMVIVAGTNENTLTYMKADASKGHINNFLRLDLINTSDCQASGDGTVPEISSTVFKGSIKTIAIKKENFFDQLSNNIDFHGLFLRDSRVLNIIFRFFKSDAPETTIDSNHFTLTSSSPIWYSVGDTVVNLSPF
jgi:hypothetical protein